ncbi:glycosyltransferase WbuB, partial [Morganella morganii]
TYTAGDPIDFKKKLLKILNDDNILSEMKKNAQILFNESYSSDNIYDNLVIYLEETHQFFGEKYDK